MKPIYIVLDGMDGSGKGSQIELLKKRFAERAVFTREPGGTPFAEEIRRLVRDNPLAGESTPLNNFLLFWAAREETMEHAVMPALRAGKHVFSDRGDSSTFAFQLYGEQQLRFLDLFWRMRDLVFNFDRGRRLPGLYIVFDLPAEMARERALKDATRTQTHFDVRSVEYYQRVREGFQEFAERYSTVELVDAARSPRAVHHSVLRVLKRYGIE